MNLPALYLADLPAEAALTGALIREACQALKRNRQQYLAGQSSTHIVRVVAEAAANWLEPDFPLRRWALRCGQEATGFSEATLIRGLDNLFASLGHDSLRGLMEQEFGQARRLEGLVGWGNDGVPGAAAMVHGPELLVHIAAGNVPNPSVVSLVFGLLLRSAQFMKCARGTSWLPRLFAHSLHEIDSRLASCLEIAEWAGGDRLLEDPLLDEAACLAVTGSDQTLAELEQRCPSHVRFVGHGHRVSFAYVEQESLSGGTIRSLIRRAVDDIVAWNQLGCLSPHVIYVQTGGATGPEAFAEALAAELARREVVEPRGPLPVDVAATIASRRDLYRLRAAAATETQLWTSEGSTAWTVVFEAEPRFQISCLNRFVYVKAVRDLGEALRAAEPVRTQVSTVGLGVLDEHAQDLALELARWGVTRVCPLGRMQTPALGWRRDGRPPLGELVSWTDWER